MTPKLAAAMITGTIARPSSPSVRLTALPAPTITSAASGTNSQPSWISTSLRKGSARALDNWGEPISMKSSAAAAAMANSMSSRTRPEKPSDWRRVTLR